MRSKIVKRIISAFLTATMLFTLGTTVFANEEEEKDYTVTYSAEEITEIDALVELALNQPSTQLSILNVRSDSSFPKQLTAVQMLERREFNTGEEETTYAMTSIALSKSEIERRQIIDKNFNEYLSDNNITDYTVTMTLYYTIRGDFVDMIHSSYTGRINKVVTNIIKERVTSINVSSANHMYKVSPSAEKWQTINFNNSAGAGGQSFTLASSHSGFYECNNDLWGSLANGVAAQATFDFSNGEYSALQTFVYYDQQIS